MKAAKKTVKKKVLPRNPLLDCALGNYAARKTNAAPVVTTVEQKGTYQLALYEAIQKEQAKKNPDTEVLELLHSDYNAINSGLFAGNCPK